MGSAKVLNANPQTPMDNKPIKTPLLVCLKNLFRDKKKERAKNEREIDKTKPKDVIPNEKPKNENIVANIVDTFKNLDLKEKEFKTEKEVIERKPSESEEDDEFRHFTFKSIEDDRRRLSSEDSGFSETKEESQAFSESKEEVIECFDKLKLEDEEKDALSTEDDREKKKNLKEVRIKRGPVKTKVDYKVQPYAVGPHDVEALRQISQINKNALSGGQVIVNAGPTPDNYNEFDIALKQVEQLSQTSIVNQSEYWEDVLDLIDKDSPKINDSQTAEDFLKDFKEFVKEQNFETIAVAPNVISIPNAIEEFSALQNLPNYEDSIDLNNPLLSFEHVSDYAKIDYVFPTPPRSETVPSPMSESHSSFYHQNWENSLSPERSSPIYNTDYELYQEIGQYEELSPISVDKEEKKRERTSSMSSMTMKNFKDLQKEISNEFSKKDCCLIERKSCKEHFDEHVSKLNLVERKNLCFNVAKMDLENAYGILKHIMQRLSTDGDKEDLQYALFVLVCQRVLAQNHALFIGDFGLSLLKIAVMRCSERPLLTRFMVYYVYAALRKEPAAGTAAGPECVFPEVDAQGDNLIIACARSGDTHALVLTEITRSDVRGEMPPLFRVQHTNAEGYTALHVACSQHSATSSRLHTLHVLLEHAQADVWKGDIKGGDTALHLAVNSVNCDLRVIMVIFKQLDRKLWKKLAHCQNMSSVTPLEYARSATKSTTRQNYPPEILDFLKKCR